jgi:DNA repair exonuclease SbcCD nuclease subunit
MIVNDKGERIFFITDTHFGVRNNSNEWIEIMEDYFDNFFFPLVEKNYRPGDVLFHLGDVYDSRQSLSLRVLNFSVKVFERLSSIFKDGIYVIAGNHDIWGRDSNEINSLASIKWIPNVHVLEEPDTILMAGKKILMMPWRKNSEEASEFLNSSEPHDILCCHADIQGVKFNKYVEVKEGPSIATFAKFGTVYSGHIHYAQNVKNVVMLGSPYQLTRSDIENNKSIHILHLDDNFTNVVFNNRSPKFLKLDFEKVLEMTPEELKSITDNNFVDLMVDVIKFPKMNFNQVLDMIEGFRAFNIQPYDNSTSPDLTNIAFPKADTLDKNVTAIYLISKYLELLGDDEETKTKLMNSLNKLYNIVIKQEDEDIKD